MDNNKRKSISALVVTHNEEMHLSDCLQALVFADELVVVLMIAPIIQRLLHQNLQRSY